MLFRSTRVYVLAEEEEVLLVSVAGAAPDTLERLPLLRQFLRSCEAAGWSTVEVRASDAASDSESRPGVGAHAFKGGVGFRYLFPGGRRRVLH